MDNTMDMTYAQLEREPLFSDDDSDWDNDGRDYDSEADWALEEDVINNHTEASFWDRALDAMDDDLNREGDPNFNGAFG